MGKVPGDVPPARLYFLGLLFYPRVYFLAIMDHEGVCILAILVNKKSNFGNSGTETQSFRDFGLETVNICYFCLENANSWHI